MLKTTSLALMASDLREIIGSEVSYHVFITANCDKIDTYIHVAPWKGNDIISSVIITKIISYADIMNCGFYICANKECHLEIVLYRR